jgi:hypothetical protein
MASAWKYLALSAVLGLPVIAAIYWQTIAPEAFRARILQKLRRNASSAAGAA